MKKVVVKENSAEHGFNLGPCSDFVALKCQLPGLFSLSFNVSVVAGDMFLRGSMIMNFQ